MDCFNLKNAVCGLDGANPKAEYDYVKENNISLFAMRYIYKKVIKEVVQEAIKIASDGTDGVYVTIDMDSLDGVFWGLDI